MNLGPVVDLSDSAIFAMAVANIIGLYILFPVVKSDLDSYWSRLQSGEIVRFRTS
jgi:AGCS family alanine or glycine:cation symporter